MARIYFVIEYIINKGRTICNSGSCNDEWEKEEERKASIGVCGWWIDGGLSELVFQNYMQGWMDGSKESPVAEWEQNIKGLNYYHDNIIL